MYQNENYDAYYEAEAYANQAEGEAREEEQYNKFLDGLLKENKVELFACYMALDWLRSVEFVESGLTAYQYISNLRDKIEEKKIKLR